MVDEENIQSKNYVEKLFTGERLSMDMLGIWCVGLPGEVK